MQGMHATMMQGWQSGTALDRMDAHLQAMQSMLDSMKAIKPATETLYKALKGPSSPGPFRRNSHFLDSTLRRALATAPGSSETVSPRSMYSSAIAW